jgi:hypothetical protein
MNLQRRTLLLNTEIEGDDRMYTNYEVDKEETMLQTQEDIADIAKVVRSLIKKVPGATFGVRINRQWDSVKNDPHSVIYISGMIKFWGDDYSDKKQEQSNLMLTGMLKDVAEEYQLEITEGMYCMSYMLIQRH